MTVETKTTIQASDILGLEFECPACHAKTSIPIERFEKPPIRCGQCDARGQWLVPGSEEFRRFIALGETLRLMAERNGEQVLVRFILRNSEVK